LGGSAGFAAGASTGFAAGISAGFAGASAGFVAGLLFSAGFAAGLIGCLALTFAEFAGFPPEACCDLPLRCKREIGLDLNKLDFRKYEKGEKKGGEKKKKNPRVQLVPSILHQSLDCLNEISLLQMVEWLQGLKYIKDQSNKDVFVIHNGGHPNKVGSGMRTANFTRDFNLETLHFLPSPQDPHPTDLTPRLPFSTASILP